MMPTLLKSRLAAIAAAVAFVTAPLAVSADLVLDPSSSRVTLLSTKVLEDGSTSVVERHAFTEIAGTVDAEGSGTVTIMLDSIDTGVTIRDERMRESLFETDRYPSATITTAVPAEALDGGVRLADLPIELSLHGSTHALVVPVSIEGEGDRVTVTATEPVLLDATQYDLAGGIGVLANIAGLLHIPTTVPVSFNLSFVDSDS